MAIDDEVSLERLHNTWHGKGSLAVRFLSPQSSQLTG